MSQDAIKGIEETLGLSKDEDDVRTSNEEEDTVNNECDGSSPRREEGFAVTSRSRQGNVSTRTEGIGNGSRADSLFGKGSKGIDRESRYSSLSLSGRAHLSSSGGVDSLSPSALAGAEKATRRSLRESAGGSNGEGTNASVWKRLSPSSLRWRLIDFLEDKGVCLEGLGRYWECRAAFARALALLNRESIAETALEEERRLLLISSDGEPVVLEDSSRETNDSFKEGWQRRSCLLLKLAQVRANSSEMENKAKQKERTKERKEGRQTE